MTLAPDRAAAEEVAHRLLGVGFDALEVPRTLHVVACVERDGWLHPLRVGPHSPPSPHDRFVLDLARAFSGTIVTTGAILRAEPELRYALPPGLRAVRGDRPLRPAVLTSARDLVPDHPLWGDEGTEPVVVTDAEGARRVGDFAPVRVIEGGIGAAIEALDGPVVVEAGPSTVAPLYRGEGVAGLWLSRFEGDVPDELLVGPLVEVERVEAMALRSDARVEEASGPWRFTRYHRA